MIRRIYQKFRNLWDAYLGQLVFILLALYALYRWQIWAAVFISFLLVGMFHRRISSILTELIGQINEFFLGTPVNESEEDVREGGIAPAVRRFAKKIFNWARKPFQPREVRDIPAVTGTGRKAAFLLGLADFIDGREGGFWHRKAEMLRRRADQASTKYLKKQEQTRQKEIENAKKGQLCWTHLIGSLVLSALMVIFIMGDIFINLPTVFGMVGRELPENLIENQIFSSFEILTVAVLISSGILFGIYIFDLWGSIPLIPVHLFSLRRRRWLLGLMTFCILGSLFTQGLLAVYRGYASQVPTQIEMMDGAGYEDITSHLEENNSVSTSTPTELSFDQMMKSTNTENILRNISFVAITLLATSGSILAFNGPTILVMFLVLGIVAAIGGVIALVGILLGLVHRLFMFVLGIIYTVTNVFLSIARMLATPFVQLFKLHRTDHLPDESEDAIQTQQQVAQSSPEKPDASSTEEYQSTEGQDSQNPFPPSDDEWNPLDDH